MAYLRLRYSDGGIPRFAFMCFVQHIINGQLLITKPGIIGFPMMSGSTCGVRGIRTLEPFTRLTPEQGAPIGHSGMTPRYAMKRNSKTSYHALRIQRAECVQKNARRPWRPGSPSLALGQGRITGKGDDHGTDHQCDANNLTGVWNLAKRQSHSHGHRGVD